MISLLLLLIVGGWAAFLYIRDALNDAPARKRLRENILARQYAVRMAPQSPAAYEQLADSLREAEYLEDAIAMYEKAIDIERRTPQAQGGGWLGSVGVEQKLRLTRLEYAEKVHPEQHGRTLRTRQNMCHGCSQINNPDDRNCSNCGAPLPVNTMFDTLRRSDMRASLFWESAQTLIGLILVALALFLASWMDVLVRLLILMIAVIIFAARLLKNIGPD